MLWHHPLLKASYSWQYAKENKLVDYIVNIYIEKLYENPNARSCAHAFANTMSSI